MHKSFDKIMTTGSYFLSAISIGCFSTSHDQKLDLKILSLLWNETSTICPRILLALSLSSKALISFKGGWVPYDCCAQAPGPTPDPNWFDQPARLRERCTNVLVPGDFTWCLVWHSLQISSLCYISFFKDYRVWPIQVNSLVEAKFRSHFAFLLNDIIEQDK